MEFTLTQQVAVKVGGKMTEGEIAEFTTAGYKVRISGEWRGIDVTDTELIEWQQSELGILLSIQNFKTYIESQFESVIKLINSLDSRLEEVERDADYISRKFGAGSDW